MIVHSLLLLTPLWIVTAVRFLFQGPAHSRTYERGWALTTEVLVILLVASLGERWLEVMHKGVLLCCIAVASVRDVCRRAQVRCSSATSCFDVDDTSLFGSYVREGDCAVSWVNVDGVCRCVQAKFGGVYGRNRSLAHW